MIAYGSNDGFKAYHTARGNPVDQFDDEAEIDAARLVASEWLDGRYGAAYPGTKVGYREQVRGFPRISGVDRDGYAIAADTVPAEIDNAAYEATYKQLTRPGSLIKDWTPPKYKSASVTGAVAVQYVTFNSAADTQTRFAIIDAILYPILTGPGATVSSLSGPAGRG